MYVLTGIHGSHVLVGALCLVALLILALLNYPMSVLVVTANSVVITPIRDSVEPNENSNAYVVVSTSLLEGFFVDTGSNNDTTSQLIATYQQLVQSTTKPPQFVFVTHGHPDHIAGIQLILATYPSTPIYVISEQVVNEAVLWTGFTCSNNIYSAAQCAVNYSTVFTVLTSPRTQLNFNHPSVQLLPINVLVKGESSYAGFLAMVFPPNNYALFTGDAATIRVHMWASNFFENQAPPGSDDALCAWAGMLQTTACNLQLGTRSPAIYPGHGVVSGASDYVLDIQRNINWLRALRNLTFNSCNVSYIWSEMFRLYPDFGQTDYSQVGALNTHVPADANSVNCNCVNGSPSICPVYNAPPSCMHLDITNVDTTLACSVLSLRTTSAAQSVRFHLVGIIASIIILSINF